MHLPPRAWFWLLALAGVLWLFRRARGSFWGLTLLVFPGTCAHELCHLLVGWLSLGRPVRFSLLPKRRKNAYELGSVAFANLRWYNAFFIGMAPLLLLAGAWGLASWRARGGLGLGWANLVWLYLVANLLESAVPSGQDFRIAARSPIGWLLLAAALGWGWLRFRPWDSKPRLTQLHLATASTKPSLKPREVVAAQRASG